MLRRVAFSMLLGCALASLSACGSVFDSERREAWRAQDEAACLASGQVQETAGIRLSRAVEGPGACGVDHPFRVSALETTPALNFASMQGQDPYQQQGQDQQGLYPQQGSGAQPAAMQLPGAYDASGETYGDPSAAGAPDGFTPTPELPASPPLSAPSSGPLPVSLDKSVLLSCSMVPDTTQWLSRVVQPAALAAFGSPVVEMTSFGTYSCRRRNNARSGRLSEHAFANALDVKGFRLADGRETRVLTGWRGTAAGAGLLARRHLRRLPDLQHRARPRLLGRPAREPPPSRPRPPFGGAQDPRVPPPRAEGLGRAGQKSWPGAGPARLHRLDRGAAEGRGRPIGLAGERPASKPPQSILFFLLAAAHAFP